MERSCDVCGKSFDSKIAYLMHQQPKNGILGRGQWYCCGCNKIFSTSYKKHVCRPASNPSNLPIGRTTQIFEQNALEERLDPEVRFDPQLTNENVLYCTGDSGCFDEEKESDRTVTDIQDVIPTETNKSPFNWDKWAKSVAEIGLGAENKRDQPNQNWGANKRLRYSPFSLLNRALSNWLVDYYVSNACFNNLMYRLHNAGFGREDMVKNREELKQIENVWINKTLTMKGESEGVEFYHRNVLEIITQLIQDHEKDILFDYDHNNGIIKEINNTLGFKEYCEMKHHVESRRGSVGMYKLICIIVFVDGYQAFKKRRRETLGVYITINFRIAAINVKYTIVNVAFLPSGVDVIDALDQIFMDVLQLLEYGICLDVNGRDFHVMGSIYLIVGDHKGLAELAGECSARSNNPGRWDKNHVDTFNDIPFVKVLRNPYETYRVILRIWEDESSEQPKMSDNYKKHLLRGQGLTRITFFWKSMWLPKSFFLRFGLCYIHNEPRGNFERHITYLGALMGEKFRAEVNRRVNSFQSYPTFEKCHTIYQMKNDKHSERTVVALAPASAKQIDWFVQISVFIFSGLLDEVQMKLWREHLEWDRILSTTEEFTLEILNNLEQRIITWRADFLTHLATKSKKQNSEVTKKGEKDLKSGYVGYYLKLESILYWVELIKFAGPTELMNTLKYEYKNKANKEYVGQCNNNDYEKHALEMDDRKRGLIAAKLYDPILKDKYVDYTPFSASKIQRLNEEERSLLFSICRRFHFKVSFSNLDFVLYSGFYFMGRKIERDTDVCYIDKVNIINNEERVDDYHFITTFQQLIILKDEAGAEVMFAKVTLYENSGIDGSTGCKILKISREIYIPLGVQFCEPIARVMLGNNFFLL